MKKVWLFVLALMTLSIVRGEPGPNMIVNQDFSKLDAKGLLLNWSPFGNGYELTTDNLQPGRQKAIRLGGEKGNRGLYQVIYGKPGMTYRLELDVLPQAIYEGKLLAIYVTLPLKDGTTKYLVLAEFNKTNPGKTGEWQRVSADLDLSKYPEANGAFGFWSIVLGFDGEAYVDNFSCRQL